MDQFMKIAQKVGKECGAISGVHQDDPLTRYRKFTFLFENQTTYDVEALQVDVSYNMVRQYNLGEVEAYVKHEVRVFQTQTQTDDTPEPNGTYLTDVLYPPRLEHIMSIK